MPAETNRTALSLAECCGGIHSRTEKWNGKKDEQDRQLQKALGPLLGIRGSHTSPHGVIIGTVQRKNGRRTDLGRDQSRLKLFTYAHGVPGGENMGGNIPTYFLVQSKELISRQTSSQE